MNEVEAPFGHVVALEGDTDRMRSTGFPERARSNVPRWQFGIALAGTGGASGEESSDESFMSYPLWEGIAGSRLYVVPAYENTAHLEHPELVSGIVPDFLTEG